MKPVSIIIPAYNASKTIRYCLDSLLAQNYDNFRIVVVNDGSKDNTLDILREYENKNDKICIIDKPNGGPGESRNVGLDYIQTHSLGEDECVAFVDADDWVEPDYISTLAGLLDSENVAMSACGYKWQKFTTKHINNSRRKGFQTFSRDEAISQQFIDRTLWSVVWNKMFRFKDIASYRSDPAYFGENLQWIFTYLNNLPDTACVKYSPKKLYHYIRTAASLSSLGAEEEKMKVMDGLVAIEKTLESQGKTTPATYVRAWQYLMLIEFIFYARKVKNKELHKKLKAWAKSLLKDYKKVRREYGSFRRYAHLILWLI